MNGISDKDNELITATAIYIHEFECEGDIIYGKITNHSPITHYYFGAVCICTEYPYCEI